MNNSKLFKASHRLVRDTFNKFGKADYRATFGLCVKAIAGGLLSRMRKAQIKKSSSARKPAVQSVIMMAKAVAKVTVSGEVGMKAALSHLGYPEALFRNESFKKQVMFQRLALAAS